MPPILSTAARVLLTLTVSAVAGEALAAEIVFEHASLVPMTREIVLGDQTVLVRDGRIAAIGSSGDLAVPAGATRIDASGKFLVPGLVDMHVHLAASREHDLRKYLAHGVTTVRNMNGTEAFLEWREAIERGEMVGPSLVTASPFTSRDGGPFYQLTTPESAREAARKFKTDGYDLVKVVTLDKEVFFALMDEAKKLNLPVAGHNPSVLVDLYAGYPIQNLDFHQALTLDEVLGSGMVSVEHMDELFAVGLARVPSRAELPALVARVRDANVAVTTLLMRDVLTNAMLESPERFLTDERIEAIRASLGEEYVARAREQMQSQRALHDATKRMRLQDLPFLFEMLRALVDGGVTVLAGTDSGGLFLQPGAGLHDELATFIEAGLTPYEALRAATVSPAMVLGSFTHRGTLEVGKDADLLLVERNPLEDIRALRRPFGVLARGRYYTRAELSPASD